MAEDRMAGDFGGRLRAARQRKDISLRQIASSTKISIAVLEALERNDLSRLPGGLFTRAFVRSYAAAVGLDPEATVHDFVTEFPHESVTAGHATSQQVEDTEAFESDRRMAGTLLWILLVSVPIAGGVLYFETFDRNSADHSEQVAVAPSPQEAKPRPTVGSGPAQPSAGSVERPAAELVTGPEATAPSALNSSKPAVEAATPASAAKGRSVAAEAGPREEPAAERTTGPTPGATEGGDHLTVGLSIHRPVWVSATVDGQKAIERLLQPGERQTVEVRREMVFTAGDASAISMTLNGADARALGKAGEVVTTRLNLANFKTYLQAR